MRLEGKIMTQISKDRGLCYSKDNDLLVMRKVGKQWWTHTSTCEFLQFKYLIY